MKFHTMELDESQSSLVLELAGKQRTLTLGEDAIIGTRVDPAAAVDAELVFAGYGLRAPEGHYDDFAGLDTKGKSAVYMGGGPAIIPGALAAHYQSAAERWKTLKSVGLVGAVTIPNPKQIDIPWPRIASNRGQMTMQLSAPGMVDTTGQQIAVTWNPAHADELLAGSGHTLDEIVADAEAGRQLPRFAIGARWKAKTAVKRGDVESQNVAPIYPGSDDKLKSEYVVVSAHLDRISPRIPPCRRRA
ncbi:MAG: M28 family metallopeptidase [Acidobacteriota bacterium]|nr:M28 family metallopeptidase [Acidobacteriota bacterium]